jgi:hypothetical protein
MKLIHYRIISIPGNDDYEWSELWTIHEYLFGFINLGPICTPDGEPLVFSTLTKAFEYCLTQSTQKSKKRHHGI